MMHTGATVNFKLPIIFFYSTYYSSNLTVESGQNDLHTLHFYTMTKQ